MRCDTTEVLEASEHAFNDITAPVSDFVERMRCPSIGPVRDDRLVTPRFQIAPPMNGVIGFIGQEVTGIRRTRAPHDGARDVGGLTGGRVERQGAAMLVAYGVDLGVAASLGGADGLRRSRPFPPPAQRWTLTWDASMDICSGVPDKTTVRAANRYCQ